jgi:riboflavin kinase/FMN adenylyltransferase
MSVLHSHRDLASFPGGPRVVAIGNFDGVHLGHQHLLRTARAIAAEHGAQTVALTFQPHPVRLLAPAAAPPLLTPLPRKRELIAALDIDFLVEEPFTPAFAALSPEAFVGDILVRGLGAGHVCVGYDFTFGKGRAGTTATLAQLLPGRVTIVPAFSVLTDTGPEVCSSTLIRAALRDGDLGRAALLLGRPPEIEGTIVRGAGRGRGLGIPTANLRPDTELLPRIGIYAAWAERLHGREVRERHMAAVSIGYNPTFTGESGEPPLCIEAHLILPSDYTPLPDLYDEPMRLLMIKRLRDERRFPSVESLIAQIRADIAEAVQALDPAGR